MINNQGERVVIVKNPPGKSDAEYANEMANCEGFSRMHMSDKVNAYSGCMLYFNNLAQVGTCTRVSRSRLHRPARCLLRWRRDQIHGCRPAFRGS